MSLLKTSTLVTVAGSLGIGIGVMVLLIDRERNKLANRAPFLMKAVELMKAEPEVRKLLGDSIEVGRTSFGDGWGRMDNRFVQLKVPITGENDTAFLYAYARKETEKGKFRLYKLEATFGKIANKKLILLDRTDEPLGEDTEPAESKDDVDKQMKNLTPEERRQLGKQMMKTWK